ncbi:MAG: hypothetical protein ACRCYY_10810 [Trueperaceae bacterium]
MAKTIVFCCGMAIDNATFKTELEQVTQPDTVAIEDAMLELIDDEPEGCYVHEDELLYWFSYALEETKLALSNLVARAEIEKEITEDGVYYARPANE